MPDDLIEGPNDPLVIDDSGMHTARTFDVIAGSSLEAFNKVRTRKGVLYGALYRSIHGEIPDLTLVCTRIHVKPHPDAVLGGEGRYLIKAEYNSRRGSGGINEEPVPGGPPVYRVRGGLSTGPVDHDANGVPITNAADEPIDPPLSAPMPSEIVRVEWYVQAPDQITLQRKARPFKGSLNSKEWQGAPPLCALCHGVEILEELGDGWWRLGTDIEVREPIDPGDFPGAKIYERKADGSLSLVSQPLGGWYMIYPNRGRRELGEVVDGVQQYTPILDDQGQPVTEPVSLGIDGKRLGSTEDQALIAVLLINRTADFKDLGI